ncbi:MAG: hypothetical protein KAJ43_09125 [Gemmatimonadetes bacterium]|nr:hypothetical protein [Gemmatimonadota bacterium]
MIEFEKNPDGVLTPGLLKAIVGQYSLPWRGTHGLPHWARVLENGLRIAEHTDGDPVVIALFAVLHDACRLNEGWDRGHGRRGADLAAALRGNVYVLDDRRFDLLHYACVHHTDGLTDGDPTVRSCWDADRLDLGRVHITPDPGRMATGFAARPDVIEWAEDRSRGGYVPPVTRVWEAWAGAHGASGD